MNKKGRLELQNLAEQLDAINCRLDEIKEAEEEKFDNLPESIQESERGEAIHEVIDELDDLIPNLGDVIDRLMSLAES